MKTKCAANSLISGGDNQEHSAEEYFPLPWKKTGFLMGLHLKGKGQFAIHLSREIPYPESFIPSPILYELIIDFVGKKLDFSNFVDNNYVSKLVESGLLLDENTPSAYWFEMRCSKKIKKKIKGFTYNCSLCFGKSGFNETLVEIYIGNPFKELHTQPTYVSFVPKSKDTSIKVSFECFMNYNEVCAHTGECKKVDDNLICSGLSKYRNFRGMNGIRTFEEDRCVCLEKSMKWPPERRKCVEA